MLRLDSDLLLLGREAYAAAAKVNLQRYGELMGALLTQGREATEVDDEGRRTRVRELQARAYVSRLVQGS